MAKIHIINKDGRVTNFPLNKDDITIGRSKDSDIVLTDHTVSRIHSRLVKTEEGYVLKDLGSYNGTLVNERPIQSILLKHNDQIKIGLIKLIYFDQEETPPAPADSLMLTSEGDYEKGRERIVKSSPQEGDRGASRELLLSVMPEKVSEDRALLQASEMDSVESTPKADLSDLERSNKVLFVLYEISRQLNSINDFNELLQKIMDLIFMVIDADYGYLILTGELGEDDLIPSLREVKPPAKYSGISTKMVRSKCTRSENPDGLYLVREGSAVTDGPVPSWSPGSADHLLE